MNLIETYVVIPLEKGVGPKSASVVQDGGNFAWSYCLGKSHIDSHKDPPHLTSKNMSQLFASRTLRAKLKNITPALY